MCVGIELIISEPHEVRTLQATKVRLLPLVSRPQIRHEDNWPSEPLLAVVTTSAPASWLIANVSLDVDFPLELVSGFGWYGSIQTADWTLPGSMGEADNQRPP